MPGEMEAREMAEPRDGDDERDGESPVLLDRRGVAKLLYIKPRSVQEYIKRGVLKPLRVPGGRKLLFDRRAVLASLKPAAGTEPR
jgi:hypothetical protein